ncbi:hypothetical protein FA15DRAFT_673132 [Coprinopsis marcescibilis]|uniref:Uncharacterized protein n=1 Tax=Coprinopsis marcescibilis TaxID=230819 RepID=A0A5C3KKR1_COPMA|nr:hypothetical protein FA15DRAFT_673132 [Coprinopsis marcescibilis]
MAQMKQFQNLDITRITNDMLKVAIAAGGSRKSRLFQNLVSSIKARLLPIEKGVYQIKQAIGEGITSTDVVPLVWPHEHPYDGAVMENLYRDDDRRSAKSGRSISDSDIRLKGMAIIGTVDIGVQKVTTLRLEDGTVFRKKETLLKPKVVLANTLEEITDMSAKSIRSVVMS